MIVRKELEVVAALIKRDSKILLCQRKEDDAFGLLWEFPGGKVEDRESGPQALRREIKEELGIDIEVGSLVHRFEDQIPELKINVALYNVLRFEGLIEALDCKVFGFFALTEIKRLDLAPVDKKIAAYLQKHKV
jgi:8-oxo-dGTP diphosphatase